MRPFSRLLGLDERSCLKVPRVEAVGDAFDFDLEVRTAVNAVTAKLVRFFEVVSNEKETLYKHFRPNQEPVDAKNARKIMDIKSVYYLNNSPFFWFHPKIFSGVLSRRTA